jgi:GntR family transcriptional regulator
LEVAEHFTILGEVLTPEQPPPSIQSTQIQGWSIDRDSGVPAYEQIAEFLVELIESGPLPVGARVPSERDLAKLVGVSRMTARAALSSLVQRGLLDRGVGRGTFVARAKLEHDLGHLTGFTEMIRRQGHAPQARIRALHELSAPEKVAQELGLEAGDPVFRIERLRFADDEPLTLEDSWLPAERFPGLLDHDMRDSIYELMRDAYDAVPVRAVERLEPVLAEEHQARALGIEVGAPLMQISRVAFTADGTPVEFARDHHRGDRARFVVESVTNLPDSD